MLTTLALTVEEEILYNLLDCYKKGGCATKILFLINFAGKAGTERYVENLVRIFTQGGHECRFAYNVAGELSAKMESMGIPSLHLDMERSGASSAAKRLAEYCREHGVEVIHAQYPRENIIALMSLRHYGAPRVVYTNHLTIRSGLRWRILNRIFTPKDHRIIAVCREGRDIMIENGVCPERIEVIYNGVEPWADRSRNNGARRSLGVDDGDFMLTIFARYAPEKGLDFLLDSLAKLRALTARPFKCVVCGDGDGFDAFSSRKRELGLDGCVIQAGFRSDTADILRASDLYLNTSKCNEAMSFAILEAMNAGLPLVVTDVGGNRDLAETDIVCGRVLQYGDADGFAAAILELMENDALRVKYAAAAGRKVDEEFDLNKLAWDVFRAYQ